MRATVTLTPARLPDVLLHVAVVRPVFLWGAPGIGKSSLVRQFTDSLGLGSDPRLLCVRQRWRTEGPV